MTPEKDRRGLTRRKLFVGAASLAAGGAAVGIGLEQASGGGATEPVIPSVALGTQPAGLPARQHAWTATQAVDSDGDSIPPRFDRLLFFDVNGTPSRAHALLLEAALRTLERRYKWGPSGLLFTAGWGPRLLRAPAHRVADPAREAAVGLRAPVDRRLRPVPALRVRQRGAPGGG